MHLAERIVAHCMQRIVEAGPSLAPLTRTHEGSDVGVVGGQEWIRTAVCGALKPRFGSGGALYDHIGGGPLIVRQRRLLRLRVPHPARLL